MKNKPYKTNDSQSLRHAVHCLGNGRVCAYSRGLDMSEIFGPDYSAPKACSISLADGVSHTVSTERIKASAVWQHELDGNVTVLDFAAHGRNVIVRDISNTNADENCSTIWEIKSKIGGSYWHTMSKTILPADAFWGQTPPGAPIYTYSRNFSDFNDEAGNLSYVYPLPSVFCVFFTGDYSCRLTDSSTVNAEIKNGTVYIAFAHEFSELIALCESILKTDCRTLLQETLDAGLLFTQKRLTNRFIEDETLERAADDVAFLIKCQQSVSGGIFAGHYFNISYVRDNYGTLLGLLSMGCYDEARALLLFYASTFDKYGAVHTAQATDAFAFHIHENDRTEITGYVILMAVEYFKHTGDAKTFALMLPLILWAVKCQHELLHNGMLPFNGDETYIACNIMPRTAINDGSMESTALYHLSCMRLLEYAEILDLSDKTKNALKEDASSIESVFTHNFVFQSQLYANNPRYYTDGFTPPLFRQGFYLCMHGMGGLACLNKHGVYVCPDCVDKDIGMRANIDTRYKIVSAILMPCTAGSPLMLSSYAEDCVRSMVKHFIAHGSTSDNTAGRIIGYEIGELLLAVNHTGIDISADDMLILKEKILSLQDEAGSWVEVYDNGMPSGCACRPWESGINIAALLNN